MLLTFSLGTQQYAMPAAGIEEVLHIVAITPVPGAPSFIEGVINRRGVITPVIDLRKRRGLACGPYDSTTHIVITTLGGRSAAVIVDAVHDVVERADAIMVIDPSSILTDAEGRELDAARLA